MPQFVEAASSKGSHPLPHHCRLLFEFALPGGEEEDQLGVGKSPQQFDFILRVTQEIVPTTFLQSSDFPLRSFGDAAQCRNARREDVVEGEGEWDGGGGSGDGRSGGDRGGSNRSDTNL